MLAGERTLAEDTIGDKKGITTHTRRREEKMTLGIIGGTSLLYSNLPPAKREMISTPFGSAEILCSDKAMIFLRHQRGLPPHRINARAQLAALAIRGVDRIIAIGSVGSLSPELEPGTLLIPTDYVAIGGIPSIHDHAITHIRPDMSSDLSSALARLVPEARYGGVYVQTTGPRIETVAEVRMLSRYGDVVGMTLANEATLARELGISFAALCMVDNYANGLTHEVLTYEHILATSRMHRERTGSIIQRLMEGLC